MNDAKVGGKIRGKIEAFSGKLSRGLPKVGQRLVREVLYGVQSRGSVRLSEIGRALGETTGMKKVIERLGRGLHRAGLRERVRKNLLEWAAGQIESETLLVLDPTDISKPYAEKMQYLARVRDGSRKQLRDGYWCCQVVGVRRNSAQVLPLYQELYSQKAPDFVSENAEILKAVEAVSQATGKRGVWVMDRGGDRQEVLERLLEGGHGFLIRQRGDRHLVCGQGLRSGHELASRCRLPYRETVVKQSGQGEQVYTLDFGVRKVRLPGFSQKLSLVVVAGLGQQPLLLLTTLAVTGSRKSLWRVVESYLARWRVEETIRFIKQSYRLEDIRLLTYQRLRTLAVLVMAVAYFACVYLGESIRMEILVQHIQRAAKRIYGIAEFRFYAIADGIKQVLYSSPRGIGKPPPPGISAQLPLPYLTL